VGPLLALVLLLAACGGGTLDAKSFEKQAKSIQSGFLERFGIGSSRGEAKRHHKVWAHDAVPWKAVVRLESDRIVVKEGTELR
jgi:hypothetical protein